MAALGATLAGALTAEWSAGASAAHARGPTRSGSSTLNVSTDMQAFGLPNMTPNSPAVDATAILNAAIGLAAPNRFTKLIADPGTYYFQTQPAPPPQTSQYVVLTDISGLTIDLQGSSLIFAGTAGNAMTNAAAFSAQDCTDLTLQNFSIDYDPLPFSQYVITDIDVGGGTVTVSPQAGFQDLEVFTGAPAKSLRGWAFRDGARLYSLDVLDVSAVNEPSPSMVTLSDANVSNALGQLEIGDVLVIALRGGSAAVSLDTPVGLTLQNVSIYSAGVQGVGSKGASSCLFSGVSVVPAPGSSRLVSVNGGGVVLQQAGPNNQIVDCTFISVQDDSIGVNSLAVGVVSSVAGTAIVLEPSANVNPGTTDPGGLGQMATALFVDPKTCVVYGPLGVTSIVPSTPTPTEPVTVTLDGPPRGEVVGGFLVCDADPAHRGQGLVVARNRVLTSCFARGMTFWGLSGALIEGNFLSSTLYAGIDVLQKTFPNDWRCLPNDAVTVRGNVLENCNQSSGLDEPDPEMAGAILVHSLLENRQPASASLHTAITIENNYVVNTPRAGLSLQNILSGSASGNVLQLASPFIDVVANGPDFTLGGVENDALIQIAVSPVGAAMPGRIASAALVTSAGPPAGPLSFLLIDSNGASFAPVVTGAWPLVQFVVPATAARGVARLEISASGTAVARGGMFIAAGSI